MRNKQKICIIVLLFIVLLISVGYAAFNSALTIKGVSSVSSTWNIRINNITTKTIHGSAENLSEPTYENSSATFSASLKSPGDYIEYEVSVLNAGSLNAVLNKLNLSESNNDAISFTVEGISEGDYLLTGDSKTFTVRVTYNDVTSQPENISSTFTLDLEFTQFSGDIDTSGTDLLDGRIIPSSDTYSTFMVSVDDNGVYTVDGKSPGRQFIRLTDGIKIASTMLNLYEENNTPIALKDHRVAIQMNRISGSCSVSGSNLLKIALRDNTASVGSIATPYFDFYDNLLVSSDVIDTDVGMLSIYVSNNSISCDNYKFTISLIDEGTEAIIERASVEGLSLTLDEQSVYTLNGNYNGDLAALFRLNNGLKGSVNRKDLYVPGNVIVPAGGYSELEVVVLSGSTNVNGANQMRLVYRDATEEVNYIPDRYFDFHTRELVNSGPFPVDSGMISLFVKGSKSNLTFDDYKFRVYSLTHLPSE